MDNNNLNNQMDLGEGQALEFKSCRNGQLPKDFGDTLGALANSGGGRIICGRTGDGQPVGLTATQIDKLQLDINSLCVGAFNIQIPIKFEIKNQQLVVVIQEKDQQY